MALFGRETEKHDKRGAQISEWLSTITPLGPVSTGLGLMAVVDFITMVLGIALGIAAIATGWIGLKKIDQREEINAENETGPTGKPWCIAGIFLGVIGIILSIVVSTFILN